MLLSIVVTVTGAAGQSNRSGDSDDRSPLEATAKNTLAFNHYRLRIEARDDELPALSVKHGELFQIEFRCTDPRNFNYTITAIEDQVTSTGTTTGAPLEVSAANLTGTRLLMRHNRNFRLYTVKIELRAGVEPMKPLVRTSREAGVVEGEDPCATGGWVELHPVTFPVWVQTIGWELTFNGGFAFSGLTSDNYSIRTDDKGTEDADDDVKTVVSSDGDSYRPDVVAAANLSHPSWKGFGLSFGLGLGDEAEPRYFFGPSFTIGSSFVVSGGWAGGKVEVLPPGQELDQAPINGDNTLTTLPKQFVNSFFAGITFTFVDREAEFIDKIKVSQTSDNATEDEEEGKRPEEPGSSDDAEPGDAGGSDASAISMIVGTYVADGTIIVIASSGEDLTLSEGDGEPIKLVAKGTLTYETEESPRRTVTFVVPAAGDPTVKIENGTTIEAKRQ